MNTSPRSALQQIFQAGLAAVAPDGALLRHVRLAGDELLVDDARYDLAGKRVVVLGGGKGAAPMAQALENLLDTRIRAGLVVVKYDHGLPLRRIGLAEAGHPVPDAAGLAATEAMLELARQTTRDDVVLCLFTGGASALTPAPVPGVSLEDLQRVTHLLLECGATIQELNAVRKHLSRFSGGQLARQCQPAPVCGVIVSDVVGDPLDVIASGPTAPDPTSFADCSRILHAFQLESRLPASVRRHLQEGAGGKLPETPKPLDPFFQQVRNVLVATNIQALEAAATAASKLGYAPRILTDRLTGEARDGARQLVDEAQAIARSLKPGDTPVCLLAGGETTVTLRGNGKGGRNQEMALAAALLLEGQPGLAALFAGTDGTDGPTDAAGGFALPDSAARLRAHGDPEAFLNNNDSYAALTLSGDIYVTGPTLTNVMDMAVICIEPGTAA